VARRLVERGVRFVQLCCQNLGADRWDQHANLRDGHARNALAVDKPIAGLLKDLKSRGLLESTLVLWAGEFGRTPRINKDGGRDHYPNAGSVLLAGAGVRRGAVIGATDRTGAFPATRPWTPEDVAASIYHGLGIDHHQTYFPRLPRPTPIADGQVIDGLFG